MSTCCFVTALKRVDFPTFGSPTIPIESDIADVWYNQIADMAISRDIFRAYDVRGTYPDEIDTDTVRMVANATVRYLRGRTLVVGEDGRLSSPELRAAVIDGITRAGCDVR